MSKTKRQRAAGSSAPACSAFDEDGEPMPTEHEAIAVASALIEHYEPTPDLAGSDFDKGMQALQRLMGRRPNAHALAEERSDDSQQRVVGSSELKGGEA